MAELPDEYIQKIANETLDKVFETVRDRALWAAENVPDDVTAREALLAFAHTLDRTVTL